MLNSRHSRDRLHNGNAPVQRKWNKSRDRLGTRSRSRDALDDVNRNSRQRSTDRLDSRSSENLTEVDFATEIERDIERINLMQGKYDAVFFDAATKFDRLNDFVIRRALYYFKAYEFKNLRAFEFLIYFSCH